MSDVKKLTVLIENRSGVPSCGPVPLPSLSDVLYQGPNPDGSRKKCGNCGLYAEYDQRCLLFGPEIVVMPGQVCGAHSYGEPQLYHSALNGAVLATPEQYGLTDGETSCDRCVYYDGDLSDEMPSTTAEGTCSAVAVDGFPASVQARGCCSRVRRIC